MAVIKPIRMLMIMRIKDRPWVMFKNLLQLKKLRKKPSWLTTNMIVAYALQVIEEAILSTYKKAEISSEFKM